MHSITLCAFGEVAVKLVTVSVVSFIEEHASRAATARRPFHFSECPLSSLSPISRKAHAPSCILSAFNPLQLLQEETDIYTPFMVALESKNTRV